jgi:hypothetical protein
MEKSNEKLLKVLDKIKPVQKIVPREEIEVIKYSSLNAKFVAYFLAEKLVSAIKLLTRVGITFDR